jgi:L-ascorbate metabolism protein UlaG (beta-lactamase superfamily)
MRREVDAEPHKRYLTAGISRWDKVPLADGPKIFRRKNVNKRVLFALVLVAGLTAFAAAVVAANQTDALAASGGDIQITPIMHSSVQLEYAGKVIQVDPVAAYDNVELPLLGKFDALKQADLILVTDIHPENLDPAEIGKLRKSGAPVVLPAAAASAAGEKIPAPTVVMANGDMKAVGDVSIEAVPMYNMQHGPKPGEVYHPKGRGNGYIVTLGGKRLYFMGDTECTAEVKAVKNIDVAFVPMNMPQTMTPADAGECLKAIQVKIAYPYHYEGQKRDEAFLKAYLRGSSVDFRASLR